MKNRFLFLIIESIKSPKKFFNVLYKRLFTIPSLEFLKKFKSKKIKLLYLNFWFFFSKKNINFKKICFDSSKINEKRVFNFNKNNISDDEIVESLSGNGIAIIEDILSKKNLERLLSLINELKTTPFDSPKNLLLQKVERKIFDDQKRERLVCDFQNINFEELDYLTRKISFMFYGRTLVPTKSLYIDTCFDIPESKIRGDNYLHVDRFLPNLKILYSPFTITENNAPFAYSLNSHKINSVYKNFILSAKNFDETDQGVESFLKKKSVITLKANSAIVAITNGFHGRTSFNKSGERVILFHQFNRSFDKLSYLNIFS
jgi:hypothetical protein